MTLCSSADAGYEVEIFEQAPKIAEIGAGINLLPPGPESAPAFSL